ncbi:hypothetical protein [Sphingobium algorifonticola]|uniref:hypothetical protein n=1 Tax=Sphingobium algorifonticola TaxID=2008318 RepID=UPI001F496013|nr:hypothetical protein [Sphingobium algorifonticola]
MWPGTLVEIWQVLFLCAKADMVIIMQAANTGLTGGASPDGDFYDRLVVIVNTTRIDRIYPAEHNVGHVYHADATLSDFYRELDPGNIFKPGIGKTSRRSNWA